MNPTAQFVVKKIYDISFLGWDFSITNSSLAMFASTLIICMVCVIGTMNMKKIPNLFQSILEQLHDFISNMLEQYAGPKALQYTSLVMSIFLMILLGNLIGLLPGMYTYTSQIIITAFLAITVICSVIFVGLKEQGFGFFKMFVHAGIPLPIMLFMLPIEIISFFARPVSLCLRLAINMIAGHMMLKIFAGFATMVPLTSLLVIPLLTVLTLFEILVSILQAYIFTMLTCIYLKDATSSH